MSSGQWSVVSGQWTMISEEGDSRERDFASLPDARDLRHSIRFYREQGHAFCGDFFVCLSMSQADHILQQIDRLPDEERSYLWRQLQRRMQRTDMLRQTLDRIMGSGAGLWNQDAQEWVNESRADDR